MHLKLETKKKIIAWLAFSFILLFALGLITCRGSVIYMVRLLAWGRTDTGDVNRSVAKSILTRTPFSIFEKAGSSSLFKEITYSFQGQPMTTKFDTLMEDSGTTALIALSDGKLAFERYYNGTSRGTLNTSFSIAKSIDSILIGIAIQEGFIQSVDDAIIEYLPELDGSGLEGVTIRHLLNMSTGIRYINQASIAPFRWMSDDALTYYFPDLRELALSVAPSAEQPGEKFHYNNYHPLLEGLVLERATGVPVSYYLQEKLWKPMGMEYPATWSVDSKQHAFEKMASGLNARSIDYARFGQLMLDGGAWRGVQLVPREWVEESTQKDVLDTRPWMGFNQFEENNGYYQYHWWGQTSPDGHYEFWAYGTHGQYIFICPQNRIVIVRNGSGEGQVDDWPSLFRSLEDQLVDSRN